MTRLLSLLGVGAALMMGSACATVKSTAPQPMVDDVEQAGEAPPARPVASTTAEPEPSSEEPETVAKPFLFNEAPLPVGFPDPGPVGEIVIKQYPAYRAAFAGELNGASSTEGESQDRLFRVLFRHIKQNDIPMTAPVEMTFDSDDDPAMRRMAFLYREPMAGELGDEGAVRVKDVPAMTVASLGVRGGYTEERFSKAIAQLREWLEENRRFHEVGPPRYLGYNSPFVPSFMRYGEVQVPVEPAR